MHPPFLAIMDEIRAGLRYLFQTSSPATCLISGTGHAGMEACIANLVEPGDTILIGNSGIWGDRVADMAARFGATVETIKPAALGAAIDPAAVVDAIAATKPALVFLVQGESSTGVHQSLAGVGPAARAAGALLVVDAVASLGGVPFFGDAWQVDAAYSGSQKVLSAPPGAAPLFFGERALAKLAARRTPPTSYNLDLNLVGQYWGWFADKPRAYHHTGIMREEGGGLRESENEKEKHD
jgi:alanine-glyoxylate transaminase/serine-glyoxylate transaminase/serine-pyruvate transaminase